MKTTTIRQRLHLFIETAEERKLKAIYTLFEDDITQDEGEYTPEFKAELDSRYGQYKKYGKTISAASANRQAKEMVRKAKVK
ncbi:MAG TPA: hypothetical protein VK644_03780 [Chitinophagaceae bacterium]|nr:hypothetical protein [Chitinophagaceae bacterium]